MNTLPQETLEQIFSLACDDGGATACALALTSKSIRAAACATRFHSVALFANLEPLKALVALYKEQRRISTRHRPRMKHLYLTLPFDPCPPVTHHDFMCTFGTTHELPYYCALRALFDAVAEDLQSLVIEVDFQLETLPVLSQPFPNLRELTVIDIWSPRPLLDGDNVGPLFPAVTHLHLMPTDRSHRSAGNLGAWSEHAPNAIHLRISGIEPDRKHSFQKDLQEALDLSTAELLHLDTVGTRRATRGQNSERKTHAHLRYIALQICASRQDAAVSARRRAGRQQEVKMFKGWLAKMVEYPAFENLRIVALAPCGAGTDSPSTEWPKTARAHWMERLQGGKGSWSRPSDAIKYV
ncbi:hypothetical protein TRAPUB_13685 [Trametes pubescens]|uniref:F-box domain-containing protein n=1 Tax=Trametes pubescens TaxID=154538 RepID=A0A1M2VQE6_TRAPU|nr:hypothetical protein TRAPUB_13685 [Trametes pubescens]